MWFLYVQLVCTISSTNCTLLYLCGYGHISGILICLVHIHSCAPRLLCLYFVRYPNIIGLRVSPLFWFFDLVVKCLVLVPRLIPRLAHSCRTVGLSPCEAELSCSSCMQYFLCSLQWVGEWCFVYKSPLFWVPGLQYMINWPWFTLSLTQ